LFSNPGGLKRLTFYLGGILSSLAIFGAIVFYWPLLRSYVSFYTNIKTKPQAMQNQILTKKDEEIKQEKVEIKQNFEVLVPKIAARANITQNVSPFDQLAYEKELKMGKVAHSATSSLPGDGKGKSIYLFAHSSEENFLANRANAVFYLIGELDKGDSIWIEKNGIKYLYKVYDKKITKPEDTSYLRYSDPNREVLILQTCWPIGTNWNRLMVMAQLMAV
jgi:LPXTG-site transpeptidase (sortase) family protein